MIFKTLVQKYKDRYGVTHLDLADSAEATRIHLLVFSPILFFIGIIDLVIIFALHFDNLKEYLVSIIYFAFLTVCGIFCYLFSRRSKNVPREDAYIKKTAPAYVILDLAYVAALYNFYVLNQPYNGVLTYCFIGFISVYVFSLSPMFFLTIPVLAMGLMTPRIYKIFGLTGLMDSILVVIIVFGIALYKRRIEKKQIMFLKKQKQSLKATTFGNFTLMYDGKVIKFSRTKSEELLGYLIYKKGTSVKTKELISVLWGDHADSARYGSSLRNLIVDIRHTFGDLDIQNFFMSEYNNFRINPEIINCDYYDFLAGDPAAIKSFAGEFMSQYSWAEETAAFLEQKMVGGAVK